MKSEFDLRTSRRSFLKHGAFAAGALALPRTGRSGTDPKRPNILFIIADDVSKDMMGAYGSRYVETPNFDRIAREGILFHNAFTTSGKCAPSRASILTGRHFFQNREAAVHGYRMPTGFPVLPSILEAHGYHVGFGGKGWGPGSIEGWSRRPAGRRFSEPKLAELVTPGRFEKGRRIPPVYRSGPVRSIGRFSPETIRELLDAGAIRNDDYAGEFESFLNAKPAGKPFYYWLGCSEAHGPWHEAMGERLKGDLAQVELPPYYPDDDRIRRALLAIAVEIELFDSYIGECISLLDERGERKDTLIVVTSDNGTSGGRNKGDTYPVNTVLPMAATYPYGVAAGQTRLDCINFSDLAPTFIDLAGAKAPASMTGRSFKDVLFRDDPSGARTDADRRVMFWGREAYDDGTYPSRSLQADGFLYTRNFYFDSRYPNGSKDPKFSRNNVFIAAVLDARQAGDARYFEWMLDKRPQEELYDRTRDPYCLKNLAADTAYAGLLVALRGQFESLYTRERDPRVTGDREIIEMWDARADS